MVPAPTPAHGRDAFRAEYGLEAAQAVLGHAKADVTQIYAERDLAKAHSVMTESAESDTIASTARSSVPEIGNRKTREDVVRISG